MMARAQILHENLADAGTVTASSFVASAPPSRLQNPHVSRRWQGRNGDTETISLDLLSAQSIDAVVLLGLQQIDVDDDQVNMDENATSRVMLSAIAAGGSELYDSGTAAGRIRSAYGRLVILPAAPVSARYVTIVLTQPSASALFAGRLVVGLRDTFQINFTYNWAFGYADLSRKTKTPNGQTFVDLDDRYQVLSLTFDSLLEADRYSFVHDTDRLNGISTDVLFVIDPDSDEIDRDTIWGLITDLSPPTQPNLAYFQKSYAIEERR